MKAYIACGADRHITEFERPQKISELLLQGGIRMELPCGGNGSCGRCEVIVQGEVSCPTEREKELLSCEKRASGYRLACMTTALGDVHLRLPQQQAHIQVEGVLPACRPDTEAQGTGIAIDIGTTTLAAYLYRLNDARLLAVESAGNPQVPYGADVITRLQKSRDGLKKELADCIRKGLNELLGRLLAQARVSSKDVAYCVLSGNTAMQYLLCGQSPESITAAPFHQDRFFGEELTPQQLRLQLPDSTSIYIARCISAYIGADITMSAMAAELFRREKSRKPCLLLDIGTNGEMLLWKDGRISGCSTAAGPTFEGAGIYMGMTARTGALSHVSFDNGTFRYETIGNGRAVGICGSGIIDAVAVLLQAGVIDETGYMLADGHAYGDCMTSCSGQNAFRFPGTDIVVTAADIRAVQLAKAAICAGLLTMLHCTSCSLEDVESLLLAGGFGNYMNVAAAAQIGLIPAQLEHKAQMLGNAAGMGASLILLDKELRHSSEELSHQVETIELATDAFFAEAFMEQMEFPSAL